MKISVAIGIIILNPYQKILIAKRPSHVSQPGLWELPGGKINAGESSLEALKRELFEEIDVKVKEAEPFIRVDHEYSDYAISLDVWKVLKYEGIASGKEGQIICWAPILNLSSFEFPEGSYPIIQQLTNSIIDSNLIEK